MPSVLQVPSDIVVYGDTSYRDPNCPKEGKEHTTLLNQVRRRWPELFAVVLHPKNEGKRTARQAEIDKMYGAIKTGASDIVIPCSPPLAIELKRKCPVASHDVTPEQIDYIRHFVSLGGKACVALGWEAAILFIEDNYVPSNH